MFRAASAHSILALADAAAADCIAQIEHAQIGTPHFVVVLANCVLGLEPIGLALSTRWPGVRIHAATSCLGAMTNAAVAVAPTAGIAMLAIADPAGDFGVAAGDFDEAAHITASRLVRQALADAGRAGEIPALVLVGVTPGEEEQFIAGLQAVVGRDTPIVGGSAADNDLTGRWRVLNQNGGSRGGAVVSVLFPSVPVSTSFESGYAPTEHRGIVTRAAGRRLIEIDGEPMASVYEHWTGKAVRRPDAGVANVLTASALMPLGRIANCLDDMPVYKLSHPETICADGSMTLFTAVTEGEEMVLMRGTPATLVARAASVVRSACRVGDLDTTELSAIMMFYCGGCMLQVANGLEQMRSSLVEAAPEVPIAVAFTFGEQGPITLGPVEHGNLMIAAIVFGR
jgi:hypothetical protein